MSWQSVEVALAQITKEEATELRIAEAVATVVHSKQLDKIGAAYIEHPSRIVRYLEEQVDLNPQFSASEHETMQVAAWLHDVLEDSAKQFGYQVTAENLRAVGISDEAIVIVELLSKNFYEPFNKALYFANIAANPLARFVKLADIHDNTLPWRTAQLDETQRQELAAKYQDARIRLGANPLTT